MDTARTVVELEAALLQAGVTLGLAALFATIYARYRRPHFLWWSWAWLLYTVRMVLIITFLTQNGQIWLYLHQVVTGWTAIAILGAAQSFERGHGFRRGYALAALVPVAWSFLTIFVLDNFILAASITVVLIGSATLWTAWVYFRYRRRTGSPSAGFVAGTLALWGLHHLDYPLLRAQGLLAPWSYYIDTILILGLAFGVLALVMEELRRGLSTLADLSGDMRQARDPERGPLILLDRALGIGGVTGSALWPAAPSPGRFSHAIGACSSWLGRAPGDALAAAMRRAIESGGPVRVDAADLGMGNGASELAFAAALPLRGSGATDGALVIVGPTRAPFAALDEEFLVALGQQIGAALEGAELDRGLKARTAELERLSVRLMRQHEDQRRRLARELHDETAQVFSAMKLRLGMIAEAVPAEQRREVETVSGLVDAGMESIRRVADDLRPPVLDDLGLLAALQAVAGDFGVRSGLAVRFDKPTGIPAVTEDAELALFRTLQESLSNVGRHAEARSVAIEIAVDGDVVLRVEDDGKGFDSDDPGVTTRMGLVGMQERLTAVGGRLLVGSAPGRGTRIEARIPADSGENR
ncbi:MAG: sensor histidine kinase [Gemmatimonadales bacterium]